MPFWGVQGSGGGGGSDLASVLAVGNTTGGTDILISSGDRITFLGTGNNAIDVQGLGGSLFVNAGGSVAGNTPGQFLARGGNGSLAVDGGASGIVGGVGGSAGGDGGPATVTGGAGPIGGGGVGGPATVTGGAAQGGNDDGGPAQINGGAGFGSGSDGLVQLCNVRGNLSLFNASGAGQSSAFTRTGPVVESFTLAANASATATNNNAVLAAIIGYFQTRGDFG